MPKEKIDAKNGGWIMPRQKGDPPLDGAGRPKGSLNSKTLIRKLLETATPAVNPLTGETEMVTVWDQILFAQAKKAIKDGDTTAASFLHDRLEGKPVQYVGADPETVESQKQFDNMSVDELRDIVAGKVEDKGDDIEFEEVKGE